MSDVTIYAGCHCQNFTITVTLPPSSFPLKSSVCHCDSCRHSSGSMFGTFMVIPLPRTELPSTKGLVGFKSSDKLTRWFCETCGARCWNDDRTASDDDEALWEWEIPVGIVDRVEVDGLRRSEGISGLLNRVQLYLGDTKDGGAALWLNEGAFEGMDRRIAGRDSQAVNDKMIKEMVRSTRSPEQSVLRKDSLQLACRCGSVDLTIKPKNPGQRYNAGLDACESCRKVTGSEITAWISLHMRDVTFNNGSDLDLEAECFGKYYTSEGIFRLFCKCCGASIFYRKFDRGDTIDICMGTLRQDLGNARVETWLDWDKYGDRYVAYVEDAIDPDFVAAIVRGCKKQS